MKICATIAEFNPFHNGHAYLISAVKEDFDACIAVMSGNFVQRGAPAVYDKFSRARAAVMNGADLVIELPVIYSLASAEGFALGAVKLLEATGVVSSLFFGSECGDIDALKKAAEISLNEDGEFKSQLKASLSSGMSYAKAKSSAMESLGANSSLLSSPNNILGVEYIKALRSISSSIEPMTLRRYGAMHDSNIASNSIASASHLRSLIEKGSFTQNFMPSFPYPAPVFEKQFSDIILYALRSADFQSLISVPDCSPALASRFLAAAGETSAEDIIACVKSKNFTESRIRRVIWNLILKNSFSPCTDPEYLRVLAMNERGAAIISEMKKKASLPVVQRGVSLKENKLFLLEARATDIYNIARSLPSGGDFRHSTVIY